MKDAYKIFKELEERNKRANPYKFYDKDELIDEILKDEDEIERLNNIINESAEELQKIIDEVNNKTLINVGQFAIRLETIQDELVGGSDKSGKS